MSFSLEHLDDRPRVAGATRPSMLDDDVNWYPLVRAAFLAALTVFLVKLVSLGFFAARAGIQLEIQFWRGWIPHLSMETPPAEFARIVTSSTLVMAIVATVLFTVQVLRSDAEPMVVWGWFMGVFVAFETLLLELLRHALEPPVVDAGSVWRTAIPLTAGAAIAVAYRLIVRDRVEAPAASVPRAVVATADGSRAVDARPAARQGGLAGSAPAVGAATTASVFAGPGAAPAPPPATAPTTPVPNRVVDTRRNAPTAPTDPMDLPAPRAVAPRPAADVGPAPIVDTRPAALARRHGEVDVPAGDGSSSGT